MGHEKRMNQQEQKEMMSWEKEGREESIYPLKERKGHRNVRNERWAEPIVWAVPRSGLCDVIIVPVIPIG